MTNKPEVLAWRRAYQRLQADHERLQADHEADKARIAELECCLRMAVDAMRTGLPDANPHDVYVIARSDVALAVGQQEKESE